MKHPHHSAIRTAIDAAGAEAFAQQHQLSIRTVERLYGGAMPELAQQLMHGGHEITGMWFDEAASLDLARPAQ